MLTAQGNIQFAEGAGHDAAAQEQYAWVFERDFDINPFTYALGTSRTLRPL